MAAKAVTGNITVTNTDGTEKTYSIAVNPDAVSALDGFVKAQAPKYPDAAALIIRHLADGLFAELVQRYPPASVQAAASGAADSQAALAAAIAQAVQGTVTVA